MFTEKTPKNAYKYICEYCDFKCNKKCDYTRHSNTLKHKMLTKCLLNVDQNTPKTPCYICICGKKYSYKQSLYVHKKKCLFTDTSQQDIQLNDLVMEVVKQNQETLKQNNDLQKQNIELHNQIIDLCKNGIINTTIVNTNSHNKTFNLNMFLNEECKDAMNLTDFVDSLQFQLSDLEKVGELGYVTGLSNFIIRNLKALDIHKRPVHCSDTKRETIFIKEADKWEKENEEKDKLHKAIKIIANKNIRLIPKWREKYPECAHSDSCKSDQYNNIIIHSLDTNKNSNPKIITNIAKEVKIVKYE